MRADDRQFDALIFDLFGVVIAFDDQLVYERLAEHCANPAAALVAMRDLVSQPDLIRGQRTLEDVHQHLVTAYGLRLSSSAFKAAWLEPYSAPMPGMKDLLDELSSSYRLILLSNVDRYYWEVIRASHAEVGCFSRLLLSWEQGVAKPDLEAFRRAFAAAGTDAARCFFIDDKVENVKAAQSIGIRGHVFKNASALREAFCAMGVI